MSVLFKKKGDKLKYSCLDKDCIARSCFNAGLFQHYNSSISGARSVTKQTPCCINREYRGCDTDENKPNEELLQKRKKEGWKQLF